MHGLHVSPSGSADNMRRFAEPGASLDYEYLVDVDHPSGLFWYHAHAHGATALQVDGGLAGAIVVLDAPSELAAPLAGMREHVLVLQQFAFGGVEEEGNVELLAAASKSDLPQALRNTAGRDVYYLVNGQLEPQLSVQRGEPRRLRFVNAGG